MTKVVIIGSQEDKWKPSQIPKVFRLIDIIIQFYNQDGKLIVVSGGCPYGGVDIWAEERARDNGIKPEIYPPKEKRWYYYMKRNKEMAEVGDIIIEIEPKGITSGARHVVKYAKEKGKETHLFEIE